VIKEEESEEMHQLAKRFGCYPPVLGQVANFIRLNPAVTISSYLGTTPELDERKLTPTERYKATLQSVFDHVRDALPPLALKLLQICAYLNADSISKDYLITWLKTQKECSDASAAQKILTMLVNRGLLHFDPAKQTFSMHSLFQEVLKSDEGFIEAAQLLLEKGRTFNFNSSVDWETTKKETDEWTLHVQKIVNSSEFNTLDEENQALIMYILGEWLYHSGKYFQAHKNLKFSLNLQNKYLKADNPQIAVTLNLIGSCLSSQGKYEEALQVLQNALKIQKKVLDTNHKDIATSLSNIGNCFVQQQQFTKALRKYNQALEIRKNAIEPNHLEISDLTHCIAFCLTIQGKYNEALDKHYEVLEIRKKK